jgi:uncharacterized membrane protein
MSRQRLEAFSDGVIAILITIMVLELKVPRGDDLGALAPVLPHLLTYLMSFVYLGIYWANHHHLLHLVHRVNGAILWANLHLLFWLSLFPAMTGWIAETRAAALPTALYGAVLLCAAFAWVILQSAIVADQGPESPLAAAVGRDRKGKLSQALYAAGVALAFVDSRLSVALYVAVAAIWLVPDRRIEARVVGAKERPEPR